ncbi:TAT-variant-translocated molybdopterin oxidoreductase [Formosa algae]|uniref:Molybdopterin-containing oxidoreductase family iron-sulfur binding subunit n=1 Tax=Formosa algae TaxID=225843 RepID=A0A9X0YJP9_9FLAO|nr:TAT-variant-translocated molybdopterin oxidoreductase [Formosa algae]MBP1838379.1 molybdopterin-containing oxidoreductase family iron-sulfur binding subunit [Formosa algae]MDQ0334514.1 molybdopterin-containing oxidoreductase family iron-sulfur binding subunit [Formosa algae]OEI79061.1 quinol:cytochrome C oxidoreductase [Formosa algae]
MSSNKKYWKSVEELNENSSIVEALKQNEFVEEIPTDEFLGDKATLESSSTTRRDFLKYVGFSTAAASLAACEGPVIKSIPYVVQPEQIIPGVANYYATTIADGFDFTSVLVKTREGRPIKIENNSLAKTNGSANARVNASVLGLYDSLRVQGPLKSGNPVSWSDFNAEISSKLSGLSSAGKEIVLLTQTFASPSTERLINTFKEKYGKVRHVVYDAVSESAALDAYQAKYGHRALADYNFADAETIVSFGADFIGDWQGGGFDAGYSAGRIPKDGKMSLHLQFEANMSLTGANADKRYPSTPSQQKIALAKLYGHVVGGSVSGTLPEYIDAAVKNAAAKLKKAGRAGVVVTGLQDVNAQALVLEINAALRSKAFRPRVPILTRQGNDKAVSQLVADMKAGRIGGIIMSGVNPLYSLPNTVDFAEGLKKTELAVTFSMKSDETASQTEYLAAAPHYLEAWGDVELKRGHFALTQPTIRPLFDTKQFQEALLAWTGNTSSYHDYIKETWNDSVLGGASFNQAIHDGSFIAGSIGALVNGMSKETIEETKTTLKDNKDRTWAGNVIHDAAVGIGLAKEDQDEFETSSTSKTVNAENGVSGEGFTVSEISGTAAASALVASAKSEGLELVLYTKVGMGDGQQANNPWLQEFPDPITRTSWDNYLTVSKSDAEALGLMNKNVANGGLNGSYASVTVNGVTLERVPVLIQPGQAKGSVGLSFGYGRYAGLKDEMKTGVNAFGLYQNFNTVQNVTVAAVDGEHEFACVQLHNTLMGRGDIIKETTLEIFNTKDKSVWNPMAMVSLNHVETPVTSPDVDLWDEFDRSVGHHFNLSIDLNACTGCGACVIACHAENNVPVVGKSEIRRSRDMHWLRIDRYYSSDETFDEDNTKKDEFSGLFGDKGSLGGFGEMEHPSENPQVAFQPVMCQHCNHAPCETVCPVAATSHGRQGQNQMAYNRCVGTRYCANNCPYKVRRFNWFLYNGNDEFDYHMNDDLGRMVLNPDVVVRSRGVMEKCSMCIQMTQKTILDAKRDGRVIKDGEFQTACSAACSSGAMVFGDVNDKESKVAHLKEDNRMYHLLEHVGTKPNVIYQTKVRNTTEA